jgi:hypothetical protein
MRANQIRITNDDVESLAQKLAAFTRTLSPGELAAFEVVQDQLAASVNADEPDVHAYAFGRADVAAGDAYRDDLLRESRAPVQSVDRNADRAAVWTSMIAAIVSGERGER